MIPNILTPQSLTFYHEGKPTQVLRDHPKFDAIRAALFANDADTAIELAKPAVVIAAQIATAVAASDSDDAARWFRRAAGRVEVTAWGVTVDGNAIHGVVVERLLDILKQGLDVSSWVRFITKLYQNPSSAARNELYQWMESGNLPITDDGDFLAYKRVRGNYRDIHSGKFDNSVGKVVSMSRLDVDDDRNRTCSAGLHFCSYGYLSHFGNGTNQGDDKIVLVKVNPADVVAIPVDYQFTKGRTWRYEVVGELTLAEAGLKSWEAVATGYGTYDDADYDGDYDEDGDEDDAYTPDEDDADRTLIGNVFAAYTSKFPGQPSKDGPARELRLLRATVALDDGEELDSFGDLTAGQARTLIDAWS